MPTVQIVLYLVLGVALAISLVTDLRERLIYDVVTLPTMLVALAVRGVGGGLVPTYFKNPNLDSPQKAIFLLVGTLFDPKLASNDLLSGALGLAVGFVPFFLIFFFFEEALGGGDVKLMGAVGAALGYPKIFWALTYVALVGGLQAILVLLWEGSLSSTLANLGRLAAHSLHLKRMKDEDRPPRKMLPYGVAIVLGTAWAMVAEVLHQSDLARVG